MHNMLCELQRATLEQISDTFVHIFGFRSCILNVGSAPCQECLVSSSAFLGYSWTGYQVTADAEAWCSLVTLRWHLLYVQMMLSLGLNWTMTYSVSLKDAAVSV